MTRDPQTYRWARRGSYHWYHAHGPYSQAAGQSWAEWNLPLPGNAYAVGAPNAHRNDAEIDYGRSKYRRAHSGKREALRRLAQAVRQ